MSFKLTLNLLFACWPMYTYEVIGLFGRQKQGTLVV